MRNEAAPLRLCIHDLWIATPFPPGRIAQLVERLAYFI